MYYTTWNSSGDLVALYSANGSLYARYTYDTWGNTLSVTNASGAEMASTTFAKINPIRYRGYYFDSESGLYYLQSRYYDPQVKRFINADDEDVLDGDNEHLIENNLFAYCFNNPVMYVDDGGEWPKWATKVLIGTAVIAACAIVTVATGGAGAGVVGYIAAGALKGAVIGAAFGAASGAAGGAASHVIRTGQWKGAGKAALNGAADGYMKGSISGAVTGAVGRSIKVAKAAKSWDKGTFKSSYKSMKYHYNKHVVKEGLSKGHNVVKYTNNAVKFANRNKFILKLTQNYKYGNFSWNSPYISGWGGQYTSVGKILTFWYRWII